MIGLYYRIWVDAIKRAKSLPENRENWPLGTMIFMTVSMTMNLSLILIIIEKYIFKSYVYKLEFSFLPSNVSNVVSFIILFVLPCVLVNYFFIFYRHRYEELLKKYPSKDGKLFLTYFFISIFLPLILLMIGILSGKIGVVW